MRIACIGGGPAGLYFAISMKLRDPAHDIEIFERNAPGVGAKVTTSVNATTRALGSSDVGCSKYERISPM